MIERRCYTIIIKKTSAKNKVLGKTWQPLKRDGDHIEYGYTDEVESVETVDEEVYRQTVEDLDIVAVIKAVNEMECE